MIMRLSMKATLLKEEEPEELGPKEDMPSLVIRKGCRRMMELQVLHSSF